MNETAQTNDYREQDLRVSALQMAMSLDPASAADLIKEAEKIAAYIRGNQAPATAS